MRVQESLFFLASKLKKELSVEEKRELLKQHLFHDEKPFWLEEMESCLSPLQGLSLFSLLATGQGERVLGPLPTSEKAKLISLLDALGEVEQFYAPLGGIVGYHETILRLLHQRKHPGSVNTLPKALRKSLFTRAENRFSKLLGYKQIRFRAPPFIDLSHPEDPLYKCAMIWAIEHLDEMAEIYTAGGAADRLDLRDEKNGEYLPAALLPFCGKTLLEYLIADLQAKEYVHYKIFGRQIVTPLSIMTSPEKENHTRLLAFCDEKSWFGRCRENFRLFVQPLVPAVDEEGQWGMQASCQPLLKPGGHGVIWRLAAQEGVFDWLKSRGKRKALVRQINNILPGVDGGLFAFTGIGCQRDLKMGFASCSRFVRTSEGINVLLEKKSGGKTSYCLTSIEYCDLDLYGLEDERASLWNPYSKYPANTNILFIDLEAVLRAVETSPFPGLLINAKKMKVVGKEGELEEKEMVRLESTMQNIADAFTSAEIPTEVYLTYNLRHKTISPIKRAAQGGALFETPEGCLYDLLKNGRHLLTEFCAFSVPELPSEEDFLKKRVPFLFFYHPALGPLYSMIAQKIQKGSLSLGSQLLLQIADLYLENLSLDGALQIKTEALMGHYDEEGLLHYSERTGKCFLKNVRIVNAGTNSSFGRGAWKRESPAELCEIILEEGAEFFAEDVTLKGPFCIGVPKNVKLTVEQRADGTLNWKEEPLFESTWNYRYTRDGENITVHLDQKKRADPRSARLCGV